MTYWAIGRLTVIALTGSFVFAAAPAFAACSGNKCADSGSVASTKHANKMPVNVADARAQVMSGDAKAKAVNDTPTEAAGEAAASATSDPAVQLVNADELNDLDKAASDVTDPLPKLPASIANSRAEMRIEVSSPWAQTSTIGKAFIAFGLMLTLASAARMFMA